MNTLMKLAPTLFAMDTYYQQERPASEYYTKFHIA